MGVLGFLGVLGLIVTLILRLARNVAVRASERAIISVAMMIRAMLGQLRVQSRVHALRVLGQVQGLGWVSDLPFEDRRLSKVGI